MEEMKYDIYKNNIVPPLKLLVRKGVGNIEADEDFDILQRFFKFPSVVGSHSRNEGTSYLIDLYKILPQKNSLSIQLLNSFCFLRFSRSLNQKFVYKIYHTSYCIIKSI